MKFTPAELVRIGTVNAVYIGNPGVLERSLDFQLASLASAAVVRADDLANLVSGTHNRA